MEKLIEQLNAENKDDRLDAIKQLAAKIKSGQINKPTTGDDVNNHIHTTYSFSPYSPTKAVWMAYMAGLQSCGIMDHDSIAGAEEFISAGKAINMATTIGVECRADCSQTKLNGLRINNPDQNTVCYMALHGIPHQKIEAVKKFFAPAIEARHERNRKMVEKINELTAPQNISLDYEGDILPISMAADGGTVTERHILFSLSNKLLEKFENREDLVNFLKNDMAMKISDKASGFIANTENPFVAYDLLGVLKSDMVSKFYIDATDECIGVKTVVEFSRTIGAIPAYAYLGDVTASVTGDKKAQKFEDSYIETLFEELVDIGFQAVTYMPSRNTMEQLERIRKLCEKHNMFQISGEDINSPRQEFICKAMRKPEFDNLRCATWALIGHELSATENIELSFFSPSTKGKYPTLEERTTAYENIGKSLALNGEKIS